MGFFYRLSKILFSIAIIILIIVCGYAFSIREISIDNMIDRLKSNIIGYRDQKIKIPKEYINDTKELQEEEAVPPIDSQMNSTYGQKESENRYPEIQEDAVFLTLEEILSIQNISLKDKLKGLAILNKVEKEDVDRIIALTEDGITLNEMKTIRNILERSLDQNDIECLNEIVLRNKEERVQMETAKK